MPGLHTVKKYDYIGASDEHGRRGSLQVFQVTSADTAVQPDQLHRTVDSVLLNSGYRLPRIGLGTWKSDQGQVEHAVYEAVKTGYRHVDCAAIYENEHEVGAALHRTFAENIVRREDFFVTSKLW